MVVPDKVALDVVVLGMVAVGVVSGVDIVD
jgi:hypothetical protein